MIATFTQGEWDQSWETARVRNSAKSERLKRFSWRNPDDEEEAIKVNQEGILAEIILARLLNGGIDTAVYNDGHDSSYDVLLPDKRTIEVKYRKKRYYEFSLATDSLNSFKSQIGILLTPVSNQSSPKEDLALDIRGWISRQEFARLARVDNFGRGKRLVVAMKCLHDFDRMLKYYQTFEGTT